MGDTCVVLHIAHGGSLVIDDNPEYFGGIVSRVDEIDVDRISLIELHTYIEELGYRRVGKIYRREVVGADKQRLTLIDSDTTLLNIVSGFNSGDVLEICFEDFGSEQGKQSESGEGSGSRDKVLGGEGSTVGEKSGDHGSDPGELDEDGSESDSLGDDLDIPLEGSDVDDEAIQAREKVRQFKERRKARSRGEANLNEAPVLFGEAGVDDGFADAVGGGKKYVGKTGNEEQYDSSDPEDCDLVDSDDEGNAVQVDRSRSIHYDPSSEVPFWELGMVFLDVKQFREAVSKYAVAKGLSLLLRPNEPHRVRVSCKKKGCPWVLFAGIRTQSQNFIIKTYNPVHRCHRTNKVNLCNSNFLASHFRSRILSQPSIRITEIQSLCKTELNVYVSFTTCRRAKLKVLSMAAGDHVLEFERLHDYCDEIVRSNPGTTCFAKGNTLADGTQEFKRFYVCFHAVKKGFTDGCRKIIGLDGCFLKGPYKGQLLVACSKDGNNQMFPIAWGVVEIENKQNWKWFIGCLKSDFGINSGDGWTIMTDMQKGLIPAIEEDLPLVEHRMCARHVLANWAKKWKGEGRRMKFWECSWSTFEVQFKDHLTELSKLGTGIVEDLLEYTHSTWCRAFFNFDCKCDVVDNNMCESFNGWILEARFKSIISMLETIRVMVMNRITKMRDFADTWISDISPVAMTKLEDNKLRSMKCNIHWNGEHGFEIVDGVYGHTVDLQMQKCTCRAWELRGIPCAHAVSAMYHRNLNPEDYVSHWYRKSAFLKSYANVIKPVRGIKLWPDSTNPKMVSPEIVRTAGRPKKARRKDKDEPKKWGKLSRRGTDIKCTVCKQSGHNRRSCPTKPGSSTQASSVHPSSSTVVAPSAPVWPSPSVAPTQPTPATSVAPTPPTPATSVAPTPPTPATSVAPTPPTPATRVATAFQIHPRHTSTGSTPTPTARIDCQDTTHASSDPRGKGGAAAGDKKKTKTKTKGQNRKEEETSRRKGKEISTTQGGDAPGSRHAGPKIFYGSNPLQGDDNVVAGQQKTKKGPAKKHPPTKKQKVQGYGLQHDPETGVISYHTLRGKTYIVKDPRPAAKADTGGVKKSAAVNIDLGFKPPGLKWKQKEAVTTRQLQQQRAILEMQQRQTRSMTKATSPVSKGTRAATSNQSNK